MAIETNEDVANRVRGIAAEKRLSRGQVASILSLSAMAVSRRFNGVTPFNAEELIRLGRGMGVPVAAFFVDVAESQSASSLVIPTPGGEVSTSVQAVA